MTVSKRDKRTLKHKSEKNDDSGLSRNFGENIRHRKRIIHEMEKRMEQEDALRELAEEQRRLGLYDENY